jgi:ribonuclease HI
MTDAGLIVVYIDGSCTNNGRADARAGVGVFHERDSEINASVELPKELGPNTNQRAELYAAILALERTRERMKAGSVLELRSDSIYLVKGITEWIHRWKANGWTRRVPGKKTKTTLANADLWKRLDETVHGHPAGTIKWTHVPGHASVFGNEMADSLATAATNKK